MNFLTIENVAKSYGDRILFEDVTMYINQGDKVAFVAKNGSGKSSLIRLIMGDEEVDSGKVFIHPKIKMAHLSQDPDFNEEHSVFEAVYDIANPVVEAILAYDKALLDPSNTDQLERCMNKMDGLQAWDYDTKIKQILSKLDVNYLDRKIKSLSGGQLKRVALAKVLIDEPDLLILDEPTNHLDLNMIEWLEEYLKRGKITLFMVTHDRYFLDNVCDQIVELDQQKIYKYKGNYAYYLEHKVIRQQQEQATVDKAKNLYRKELDWMRRQPKARGTKAKARIDAFFDVEKKAKTKLDKDELKLDIKMQRLGSKIIELHNVSKRYDDLCLIDGFNYKFAKKDRVGIIGNNGTGKTTLLNIITGKLQPDTGKVVHGETLLVGYYTQKMYSIKEDLRVIEAIRDIAEFIPMHGGQKITARQLCERFLFDAKKQLTYISKLSGGEKRRLHLLTILMKNPNFLILDEPTNDLDIMTLQVLEDFLVHYPGVVLIVSHDRHFMDKIVEHTFVFEGNGIISDFPGNYSQWRDSAKKEAIDSKRKAESSTNTGSKTQSSSKLSHEQQKEIKRLENQIDRLEKKKKEIEHQFSDMSLDPDQMKDLAIKLKEIEQSIEKKEEQWMDLIENSEN